MRVLFAGASDETPDRQGRVMIPAGLRTYAGLDRDVRRHRRQHPPGDLGPRDVGAPTWPTQEPPFADLAEEVLPGVM